VTSSQINVARVNVQTHFALEPPEKNLEEIDGLDHLEDEC